MISRLKKYKYYRKLIFSFLTLMLVSVLFMSVVLSRLFYQNVQQETEELTRTNLIQTDRMVYNLYESLKPILLDVLSTEYIGSIFSETNVEYVDYGKETSVYYRLNMLKRIRKELYSISLINFITNRYVSSTGFGTGNNTMIDPPQEKDSNRFYVSERLVQDHFMDSSSIDVEVISFVYYPSGVYSNTAIVIDIKKSAFEEMLENTSEEGISRTVIAAENGAVLIGMDDLLVKETNWQEQFLSAEDEGVLKLKVGEISYTARYIQSQIPNWYIVHFYETRPIRPIWSEYFWQMILLLTLFVGVEIFISILFVRRIYQPVKTLNDLVTPNIEAESIDARIDEMGTLYKSLKNYEEKIKQHARYRDQSAIHLRNDWINSLLRGNTQYADFLTQLDDIDLQEYEGKSFLVSVIHIDHTEDYIQQIGVNDRQLLYDTIFSMSTELFEGSMVANPVIIDEEIVIVFTQDTDKKANQLKSGMGMLQKTLWEQFKLSVSVAFGSTVSCLNDVSKSFNIAHQTVKQRFYSGPRSIIEYTDLEFDGSRPYSLKAQEQVSKALLSGKNGEVDKSVESFLKQIGNNEIRNIRAFSERCANDIFYQLIERGLIPFDKDERERLHTAISGMENAEFYETLKDIFRSFIIHLMEQSTIQRNEESEKRDPINQAVTFINENYRDPNLSVDYLAAMVGLTPSYFGKLFHSARHVSCSDYINSVRISAAAELLRSTDMNVESISEAIGVSSTNYFYTLFKNRYGITPTQYRRRNS